MGSWNETCALSHLQILYKDKIKVILLLEEKPNPKTSYITNSYAPFCLPFSAEYNDCGGIQNVSIQDYTVEYLSKSKMVILEKENGQEVERQYEFTDIETLINDLKRKNIYVLEYGYSGKSKLTYIYYHEDLFNILVEDFKSREVYKKDKCYYELLVEKYIRIKEMITKYITLDASEEMRHEHFREMWRLSDKIRDNMYSVSGYEFKFGWHYIDNNVISIKNLDDFVNRFMEYILFSESLNFGRYGYYCIPGSGGQDRDVRVQRLVAKFILEFSERKYEYEDDAVYTENETIFWDEIIER